MRKMINGNFIKILNRQNYVKLVCFSVLRTWEFKIILSRSKTLLILQFRHENNQFSFNFQEVSYTWKCIIPGDNFGLGYYTLYTLY